MARRTTITKFFADVGSALLRISHRVPLVGFFAAIACGVGWWFLHGSDAAFGIVHGVAIGLAVLGGLFLLLAIVGWLRNLFPDAERRRVDR